MLETHKPTIIIEGPTATHDMACAHCHTKPAVYDLNSGKFQPCWSCQKKEWTEMPWYQRLLKSYCWDF